MPVDLCDVDDVKLALDMTTSRADDLIAALITAASSALGQRYQREFIGPGSNEAGGTRTVRVQSLLVDLSPWDLRTVGSVVLHPEDSAQTLVRNSDYALEPLGGARLGGSYQLLRLSGRLAFGTSTMAQEFGYAQLQIAGDWGCFGGTVTVDEAVRRACVLTVASWMDRGAAEYGMGGGGGREMVPDRQATYAIPAAAHALLQPWGRVGPI